MNLTVSKSTESGLGVNEDWPTRNLGEIFGLTNGLAFKPSDWKKTGNPIIRIQNLNDKDASFNYFQGNIPEKNTVNPGDLLFAWSGTLGSSFGARVWDGPSGVLNQHIFKVEIDEKFILKEFALLAFSLVEQEIARESHGFKSSFVHVKKADLQRVALHVPPISEQRSIAATIYDADNLLVQLEKLIIKNSDLKQAAMQQLLTGQTRLPGFAGEWEVKQLGELLRVRHGKDQKAIETPDGKYPILATGGEIGRTNTALHDKSSVLIGRKGTIDRPIYMDSPFWTVDTLFYTEVSSRACSKFLYYQFLLIDWYAYNEASGVPSLNASTIENIEIQVPDLSEQSAIATVLSDMDTELAALESRRDKTRALKQGMMQELLTGRIRLV